MRDEITSAPDPATAPAPVPIFLYHIAHALLRSILVENFPSKHQNIFTRFYSATSCKVGNWESHEITF
jgi:hypothetical protein